MLSGSKINPFPCVTFPHPDKPGEALIRVRLSGICGTDLELVRGYYPFTGVPGHEFVGEVVEIPTLRRSSGRMDRQTCRRGDQCSLRDM